VTLIHRRDELRADKTNQARLFANPKVEMLWNATVSDVHGEDGVSLIELTDTRDGTTREMAVDGLFVAIGHDPATALFKGQVAMDEEGYILVNPGTPQTSVAGVFAAGDVTDKVYRQAVTAAGMGCMAALEAERFLAHGAAHETREAA
jgi:thioredoxin reductase (NADPH)